MTRRIIFHVRVAGTLLIMFVAAILMTLASVLTLFQTKHLLRRIILTPCARMILRLWGIRQMVHRNFTLPNEQAIYISNHTSTLDVFLLLALDLPRTRFFLFGGLRKNPLIAVIGYLMGVFWTVPQTFPEERRRIFQSAEKALRKSGESVFLSPEGKRITTGEVGHFNKGAFHLGTNLRAPIYPIFIAIPDQVNPGAGIHAQPGVIHTYFKPPIRTADWMETDLMKNRDRVRSLFIEWNHEHRI